MGPLLVVTFKTLIEICLEMFERFIDTFAERHAIDFVLHGRVESFADAVGLGVAHLRPRMLDLIELQIELVRMHIFSTAKFGAAVSQHAQDIDVVLLKEGQDAIVETVGSRNRRLLIVHLGEGDRRIRL